MMKTRIGWLVLFFGFAGFAQNNMQANINLQFRFANPGARAQAMGGAFVGLADDATAIFANPAGLSQLRGATLTLETSGLRRANPIPFFAGRIEQTGLQDFRFDLERRDFPETNSGIPFLGYVHGKGRVKWGVFYAELADFSRRFETEGVAIPAFPGGRPVVDNTFAFFLPSQNEIELSLRSIGASIAAKLSDRISLGVTVSYNDFAYRGATTLVFPDLEALFPEINFSPRDLETLRPLIGLPFGVVNVEGDDQQPSFNLGLLASPNERFSLGLAYKRQPEFDYNFQTMGRDEQLELVVFDSGTAVFDVPDNLGAGFSFKPTEAFVFSVEANRVFYSELSDNLQSFFVDENDPSAATQSVDDITEYHLGAEYFLINIKYPLALRAGYWFEPYHALKNTNTDTQLLFRFLDANNDYVQGARQTAFLQRFEKDENHLTFGLGLSLGRHLVLDLSGDIARETQTFSLSGMYRF